MHAPIIMTYWFVVLLPSAVKLVKIFVICHHKSSRMSHIIV